MKNAICMLIFGDELYVVGACLNAFVNKKFIDKLKIDIELVAMVDENIYKYKKEMEKYFDKIVKIDMIEIKLNKNYSYGAKYSKWMKYSVNKWQFLKLTDYSKVLFLDTDILPMNEDFYTIFDIRTPAFCSQGFLPNNVEFPLTRFIDKSDNHFTMENCWNFSTKLKNSIDAGTVLIKPDKKLYEEYKKFIEECAGKQGYVSADISGVDETTFLLFYYFYKKIPVYSISYNYAILPFNKHPYDLKKIKAFNYMSMFKPWVLLPMLQWPDQNIWHKIAKKALVKSKVITNIYVKYLFTYLKKLIDDLKWLIKKNNYYNLDGVKANQKLFNKISMIIKNNYNDKDDYNKLDYDKKKEIMDIAQSIHKTMDKKSIVEFNIIEDLINK